MYVDPHKYGCITFGYFSLVNLTHVYLIIRQAERTLRVEESFFPTYTFLAEKPQN